MTQQPDRTSRLRSLLGRERGFTFIELMIVIAIIAVIAGISIPPLIEARKGANEAAAIGALRTISTAQTLFRDEDKDHNGLLDYAQSLHVLAFPGGIDQVLETGRDHGYAFYLETSGDRNHWSVVAAPAAINRSGDHVFAIDETEVVTTDCPPGQHRDPLTGKCLPQDTLVSDAGIAYIQAVDALSVGMALPAAKMLAQLVPTLGQQALMFMDTNHDGRVTFDEALRPDLLGATLTPILQPFTDSMRRDLALGIANEQLTGLPVTAFGGDLLEFLNRVPPFVPGGPAVTRK